MDGGAGADYADYSLAPGALTIDLRIAGAQQTADRGAEEIDATAPLAGGQWRRGTDTPYELVIVSNAQHPEIPTAGTVEPLRASARS